MSTAPNANSNDTADSDRAAPARATTTTMRALVRDHYGSADVLESRSVARPAPGAGEVLVRVRAAGLDRGAWHIMAGQPYLLRIAGFGLRRPKDPGLGTELAGVVESVGAGVRDLRPGDEVFGAGKATFAEYAVAKPEKLGRKPANLSFAQAAAVPVSALTALQALRNQGRLQAGQSVLIIGASGGVGSFAVQLAKAFGAQVTGVCRTEKLDLVRSLGADHVIDYTAGELTGRYDLVLDIGGNRPLALLRRLLAPRGALVFVGGEGGDRLSGGLGRQLRAMLLSPFSGQRLGGLWVASQSTADLDAVRELIEAGQVTPALDRNCPLDDLPAAIHDLVAGRIRGKVVTTP